MEGGGGRWGLPGIYAVTKGWAGLLAERLPADSLSGGRTVHHPVAGSDAPRFGVRGLDGVLLDGPEEFREGIHECLHGTPRRR